jgi:hypothetical protein
MRRNEIVVVTGARSGVRRSWHGPSAAAAVAAGDTEIARGGGGKTV